MSRNRSERAGDVLTASMSLGYGGACAWGMGDVAAARRKTDQAIAVARNGGSVEGLSRVLMLQGWLETERDPGQAEPVAMTGEAEAAKLESVFDRGHYQELRGFIHCLKGDFDQAADALAGAMTTFEQIQINCGAHILETAAAWAAMTGRAGSSWAPRSSARPIASATRPATDRGPGSAPSRTCACRGSAPRSSCPRSRRPIGAARGGRFAPGSISRGVSCAQRIHDVG